MILTLWPSNCILVADDVGNRFTKSERHAFFLFFFHLFRLTFRIHVIARALRDVTTCVAYSHAVTLVRPWLSRSDRHGVRGAGRRSRLTDAAGTRGDGGRQLADSRRGWSRCWSRRWGGDRLVRRRVTAGQRSRVRGLADIRLDHDRPDGSGRCSRTVARRRRVVWFCTPAAATVRTVVPRFHRGRGYDVGERQHRRRRRGTVWKRLHNVELVVHTHIIRCAVQLQADFTITPYAIIITQRIWGL